MMTGGAQAHLRPSFIPHFPKDIKDDSKGSVIRFSKSRYGFRLSLPKGRGQAESYHFFYLFDLCARTNSRLLDVLLYAVVELLNDGEHVDRQELEGAVGNGIGNLVAGLSDGTGDGALRVGVTLCHDGIAECSLEVLGIEEAAQRPGHGLLTGGVEVSVGADAEDVAQRWQLVLEVACHGTFYLVLRQSAGAKPVDDGGDALCAADAFLVAVAHLGTLLCLPLQFFIVVEEPSHGADAHRRPVAEGGLRQVVALTKPVEEHISVATLGVGVALAPFHERLLVRAFVKNGISNGDGTNGIVGEVTVFCEEFEPFCGFLVELEARSYNVSDNSTKHKYS